MLVQFAIEPAVRYKSLDKDGLSAGSLHLDSRSLDSLHDVQITRASTEISVDTPLDLFVARIRVSLEQE